MSVCSGFIRKTERGKGNLKWRLLAAFGGWGQGVREVRRGVLDQGGGPTSAAARASRTPKRFWLWSKYGPSGASSCPRALKPQAFPHPTFIFPGCKMPLAIRAGGVCVSVCVCECVFSPLIFTHKMCISQTKAAVIGPLAPLNFLPICRGISRTTSVLFVPAFVVFFSKDEKQTARVHPS